MNVLAPPQLELVLEREIPGEVYHVDFNSGVFWFMPDFSLPRLEEIAGVLETLSVEVNTRYVVLVFLFRGTV